MQLGGVFLRHLKLLVQPVGQRILLLLVALPGRVVNLTPSSAFRQLCSSAFRQLCDRASDWQLCSSASDWQLWISLSSATVDTCSCS